MSFSKEKREQIRFYLLEKIGDGRKDLAKAAAASFGISLNTAYRYLKEMEQEGLICKQKDRYILQTTQHHILLHRSSEDMEGEDRILLRYIQPFLTQLPDNVLTIWQYMFTEMMNNAIEHSQAEQVVIDILQNYLNTTIILSDDGLGIFRKLKEYFRFETEEDAVRELFKGKLTTDRERHSGEGVFFSSRAADRFAAVSDGLIFSHDRFDDMAEDFSDCAPMNHWQTRKGTTIYMSLSNFSNKKLSEIFNQYSSVDEGFYRTQIPIRNMFDMAPVARSQARRLSQNFERFREVELDFEGVEEIGQGFAHELFVVFQNSHPDLRLIPIHMNHNVESMLRHVLK